jgi:hypothetical protein
MYINHSAVSAWSNHDYIRASRPVFSRSHIQGILGINGCHWVKLCTYYIQSDTDTLQSQQLASTERGMGWVVPIDELTHFSESAIVLQLLQYYYPPV